MDKWPPMAIRLASQSTSHVARRSEFSNSATASVTPKGSVNPKLQTSTFGGIQRCRQFQLYLSSFLRFCLCSPNAIWIIHKTNCFYGSISSIESSNGKYSLQDLWIIQENQDIVFGKTHCYWIFVMLFFNSVRTIHKFYSLPLFGVVK